MSQLLPVIVDGETASRGGLCYINGVDIPLSCEMGICGTCLTPVVEGIVDHRDTVQSDAEKSAG